jgi:hypothetical protein
MIASSKSRAGSFAGGRKRMRQAWNVILIAALASSSITGAQAAKEEAPAAQGEHEHGKEEMEKDLAKAKNVNVEFVFSGLVAMARKSCAADPKKEQTLHILMMKGEQTGNMKHRPRLVVEGRYAGPVNEPSEIIDVGDKQYFIWNLEGYRVELEAPPPQIGIVEGRRKPTSKYPGSNPEPDDFSWVPELNKACGVKPEDLKFKDDVHDTTVLPDYAVARFVDLKIVKAPQPYGANLLKSVHESEWKSKPFTFDKKNYMQSLAERASLMMKLKNTNPLKLKLVPLVEGLVPKEIQVRPTQLGSSIRVAITNFPAMQEDFDGHVHHFKYFFDLLKPGTYDCAVPWRDKSGAAPVKCTLCGSCGPGLGP